MEIAAFIMSIISLLISFGALICYIPTTRLALYQRKAMQNNFHFSNILMLDEESGCLYSSIVCANFSMEPISLLRVDFVYGEDIQTVGIESLLAVSESTLIPPREIRVFEGIKMDFTLEDLHRIKNSSILSEAVRIFTTQNNEPFVINLRSGKDDSEPIIALKSRNKN